MIALEYWTACVEEALSGVHCVLLPQEIKAIAEDVMGAHENYGLAFYSPPSGEGYRNEIADLKRQIEKECSKVICRECKGSGSYYHPGPYHSSSGTCDACRGKGRVSP